MNVSQHTLKKKASFSGVGVHTGKEVEMCFLPAPANHGLKFQRVDLPDQPIIDADLSYVLDNQRNTIIGTEHAEVWTIEHTLAALAGMQVDNALITLNGREAPIMDGSAKDFVAGIQEAGLEDQKVKREFLEIQDTLSFSDTNSDAKIIAASSDSYRLTVMVDYGQHGFGNQYMSLEEIESFATSIAPCRTFCFLHEIEEILSSKLGLGGSVKSGLILKGNDVSLHQQKALGKYLQIDPANLKINSEGLISDQSFRFSNELARHKLLDLIGDLTLLGKPLKAQITSIKPGHATNILFAKKIRRASYMSNNEFPEYHPNATPLMDINQIKQIIHHEYPFLLIDKIFHLDAVSVGGIKNLTYNESFFQGHFPNDPSTLR